MREIGITRIVELTKTEYTLLYNNEVAVYKTKKGSNCFNFGESGGVNLNVYIYVLVTSGHAVLDINTTEFALSKNRMGILNPLHTTRLHDISEDFQCLFYLVTKEHIEEHVIENSQVRMYQWLVYFNNPVFTLTDEEGEIVESAFSDIAKQIERTDHHYQEQVLENAIQRLHWESDNIIYRIESERNTGGNHNHYEQVLHAFVALLFGHYKQEHYAQYYADQLSITPQYLNKILKTQTGKTATDMIFEMLYNEARTRLVSSTDSIQQIADALNFSDQAAFNKFFKRRSGGISPKDFRQET